MGIATVKKIFYNIRKKEECFIMAKKFQKLPRLVQLILLLIPVVNWITEIVVRVSAALTKPTVKNVVGAIVVVIFGLVIGWVDCIWVLLFKHLCFCKV